MTEPVEKKLLELRQFLDPDDWALHRVAELRAQGEPAKFRITWLRNMKGQRLYDVQVRRGDGTIERLSRSPVDERPSVRLAVDDERREGLRRELEAMFEQTPDGKRPWPWLEGEDPCPRHPERFIVHPETAAELGVGPAESEQSRARHAGRMDCSLDHTENVPFASVGGLSRRTSMTRPRWVAQAFESDYLEGYRERALDLFGEGWETAEFGWKLALKIDPRS